MHLYMTRLTIRESMENVSTTGFQNIGPVIYVACTEIVVRLTFLPPSSRWRCNAGKNGYRDCLAGQRVIIDARYFHFEQILFPSLEVERSLEIQPIETIIPPQVTHFGLGLPCNDSYLTSWGAYVSLVSWRNLN